MQSKFNVKDIAKKREIILGNTSKHNKILKGNKRIHNIRHCSICNKELVHQNRVTGKYICTTSHFDCNVEGLFHIYICLNPESCRNKLKVG